MSDLKSMNIHREILEKGFALFVSGVVKETDIPDFLAGQTKADLQELLRETMKTLEELMIVGLVSRFEKEMFGVIEASIRCWPDEQNQFRMNLKTYMLTKFDRWNIEDLLDLFKGSLDSDLVGNVKNVYKYRNWIAHGKKKAMPTPYLPKQAEDVLCRFLEEFRASAATKEWAISVSNPNDPLV
ncbi:hypothetical protein L6R29_13465 [Myxococcota bacterium]|nr:hypothetical protein [Myxococcota bacterium]